jgi:predicted SnoaL-like aldol condensation-catalyzing enzyme
MKKSSLGPLSLGLVALVLGCSSNMDGGTGTTSGLQPPLPVVENPDHKQLLSAATPELVRNKRLVYDFWRTLVEALDTEATKPLLAPSYIQHDPNIDTGSEGVLAFFAQFGEKVAVQERVQAKLVALVAERDFVVIAWVDEHTEPRPYATTFFDMFRIENGVLAEHWDFGRVAKGETPRAYVPPTAHANQEAALASSDPRLAANKRLVHDMWRTLLDAQLVDEAPRFLAAGYAQHSPIVNTGRDGFVAFLKQFAQPSAIQPAIPNFVQIVAEGDLVAISTLSTEVDANGKPYETTWFDLFRVDGGLLVEHWDPATIE